MHINTTRSPTPVWYAWLTWGTATGHSGRLWRPFGTHSAACEAKEKQRERLAEEEEAEKQHEHDGRERRGPQQRRWNERLEVREQEAHLCGRESERNAE